MIFSALLLELVVSIRDLSNGKVICKQTVPLTEPTLATYNFYVTFESSFTNGRELVRVDCPVNATDLNQRVEYQFNMVDEIVESPFIW